MTASAPRRYYFRDYLDSRVLAMLALGFSSAYPFCSSPTPSATGYADEGIALSAISFLSWVGFPYSLKFIWAPLLDRLDVPGSGGWGAGAAGWWRPLVVACGLVAMAIRGTGHGLVRLRSAALIVAFASSTQDVAIDAWRIESARATEELGLLTSSYTIGYRCALLMSDAAHPAHSPAIGWTTPSCLFAAA